MEHRVSRARRHRELTGARHAARCRLDRRKAAKMRGNSNAATGVGAKAQRRAAGGDDRRFAAAAASGRAGEVVRIVGASVDEVVGFGCAGEFRYVGLAEDDAAGGAQPGDRRRIGFWHKARAALGAAGADDPDRLQRVLDGDGHAVQRTLYFAARQRPSASSASFRAESAVSWTTALSFGLTFAI